MVDLIPGRLPGQGAPTPMPPGPPDPSLLGAPDPMAGGPPIMGPQMGPPQMMGPDPGMMAGQMAAPPMPQMPPMPQGPEPPDEPPDDGKPIYPAWLKDADGNPKPPKKPTRAFIEGAIANDELVHGQLCQRFLDDLKFYRLESASVFDALPEEDVELFTSAEPATQVNKVANMIAGITAMVQWSYRSAEEEEQARDLEDVARYLLDCLDRYHQADGNASLRWEQVWSGLIYGRIVSRVLPDVTDPDFPWEYRLCDPATVFPTFGGKRGLVRVTQVYRWPLDKVLTAFPAKQSAFAKTHLADDGTLDLGREGTMREYWDAWYRWAEFDGVEVLPVTAHELGYVPFVYSLAPGEMGQAASPARRGGDLSAREIKAGWAGNGGGTMAQDLVYKGQSFFHAMKPVIKQEEAVLSLLMTSIKQSLNPPMAMENAYNEPPTALDFRVGATNTLKPGQKPVPLLNSAHPTDVSPALAALRENRVKGMLPDHVFGAEQGSNVSGFAVESLIAAAKDRIQPYITLSERHLAAVLDMMFRQYRDIGWTVVDGGDWYVPAQDRAYDRTSSEVAMPPLAALQQVLGALGGGDPTGIAAAFAAGGQEIDGPSGQQDRACLTRAKILSIGSTPTVRLHSVALQNMTALANVASMLIERKVWSRAKAMEELSVQNPRLMMEQILAEDALTNPKMLEAVEFPKALWKRGDIDSWLAYVAINLLPQMMAGMTGGMPGGGGPGGPPPVGPGGPQTTQGASQPQVGQTQAGPTGPGNGAM